MLFMTTFDIIPGKTSDMVYILKKIKPPENIKIHEFLMLIGKPDVAIVYEARTEEDAVDFVLQFAACSTPRTSLCQPAEGYELGKSDGQSKDQE
jgi:hypothetical protein